MYWNYPSHTESYPKWLRLTLTWDVLKYFSVADTEIGAIRLTLTWDVLKLWV